MSKNEFPHNQASEKIKQTPFTALGAIGGGAAGTVIMLSVYVFSGAFLGVMAGSGCGVIFVVPIVSLIVGRR